MFKYPACRSYLSVITIAAAMLGGALPALGQDQASETASGTSTTGDGGLTDIVVTARKVSESLQTVPVAVTAFSGEALPQAGINNVFDIQGKVPNLYLKNSAIAADGLNVAMREQNENDYILTDDTAIGVYIDVI